MLFLLVLMSANAACETKVRCHQIKVITVRGSKLTIKLYKIVVDLQESIVIKVLFKAISEKFISKVLFPVKYDMINSRKIFYIRYKMRAQNIQDGMSMKLKCLKTRGAHRASKVLLALRKIFFGGVYLPPPFSPSGSFF